MANEEHLIILKQGVDVWNDWQRNNRSTSPNLQEADLEGVDLRRVNLRRANLFKANLRRADLFEANLKGANLYKANLGGGSLAEANLGLSNLGEANLNSASLEGADLSRANLGKANLTGARLFETVFNNVDLSATVNLEMCKHRGPSSVDYRTLLLSKNVPLDFWRQCGLPDALIDNIPSLSGDAIQFFSCFISYSSKDQEFANRLHADLQDNGVRCWFAPHDMRTGDRIRDTIDQQIRVHEKLLLILSENSVTSTWVENEVEAALDKEKDRQTVLFPLRIDAAIEETDVAWAKTIKRTRHITDFSGWKDHDSYQKAFQRILRDLKP